MFGKMNDYFEKNNVNKYVTLAPSNEIKQFEELWIKIGDFNFYLGQ